MNERIEGRNKGSKKARRTAARLAGVQAVYQAKAGGHPPGVAARDFLEHYAGMTVDGEDMLMPDKELFASIVSGVEARRPDLEAIIAASLKGGENGESRKAGPEPLLESIILCGLYELMAHHDTDAPVIIADYLNVTHAFYEKSEAGLVNAILDRAAANLRDSA